MREPNKTGRHGDSIRRRVASESRVERLDMDQSICFLQSGPNLVMSVPPEVFLIGHPGEALAGMGVHIDDSPDRLSAYEDAGESMPGEHHAQTPALQIEAGSLLDTSERMLNEH